MVIRRSKSETVSARLGAIDSEEENWLEYFLRMGRTGSTVPVVHTSPRKYGNWNGLEVQFLLLIRIQIRMRNCTGVLYRSGGPLGTRIGVPVYW